MLWKIFTCLLSPTENDLLLLYRTYRTKSNMPCHWPSCIESTAPVWHLNTSSSRIPGLEAAHIWISLPFCFMYIIAVVGNCGLMYIISYEEALHLPMYYFLALLSLIDISGCTSFVPNMLHIFCLSLKEIDFNAWLVQMFFIHMLTGMESGVLMLMTLDHSVAICYPLRYSTILTNTTISKVGLVILTWSVLMVIPFTFLIKHLPCCRANLVQHTFVTRSLAKLPCGNIKINAIYVLKTAILNGGSDIICISLSYTMTLHVVVNLSSADTRHKNFSTWTSHICAIVITYVPAFFNFFTHHFGVCNIPHHVHILIASLDLLLPPTLTPIERVIKLLFREKDILSVR